MSKTKEDSTFSVFNKNSINSSLNSKDKSNLNRSLNEIKPNNSLLEDSKLEANEPFAKISDENAKIDGSKTKENDKVIAKLLKSNNLLSFLLIFFKILCIMVIILTLSKINFKKSDPIPKSENSHIITKDKCQDFDILFQKDNCLNNFCEVFSSDLSTLKVKLKSLIEYHKWILTHQGSTLSITALQSYNSCNEFTTISPDGIRTWSLSNRQCTNFRAYPNILQYSFGHNTMTTYFTISNSHILKAFSNKEIERIYRANDNMPNQFFISDDDKYIFAFYKLTSSINANLLSDGSFVRSFIGLQGDVRKIYYDSMQGDLIVADSNSLKIYFIEVNMPAYEIKTMKEFKKLVAKYYSLVKFEDIVLENNFLA